LKKIILISTIILILSCKKQITEIRYYPTDREISKETLEIIGLDTTNLNFREITDKIGGFTEDNFGNIVLEFKEENIIKRIIPYIYDGGLIKRKNVLEITSDSILVDDGYHIDQLKELLKRHYSNKGKIPYYPEGPEKALVEITIDTSTNGQELKEVLSKLTLSFDKIRSEIKDTIELRVFFNYFPKIPPPPMPSTIKEE